MAKKKICIVEDEADIVKVISFNLSQEGYDVSSVSSGSEAVSYIETTNPDLVLLDLMIPGLDGFDVCRELKAREHTKHIPIIMLSAKSQEHSIVSGLELGADDYITKPFSVSILIARVRTVLRRYQEPEKPLSQEVIKIDDIELFPKKHDVKIKGESIVLTHTEFALLECLMKKAGWVFTRNQLIDAIKGESYFITDRSIDVIMVALRKKLGMYASFIETIRSVGYRFKTSC